MSFAESAEMMRWAPSAYDHRQFVSVWRANVVPSDSPLRAYHATLRAITTQSTGWLIGFEVQIYHNWVDEPMIVNMRFRASESWPFIHHTVVEAIKHVSENWNPVRLDLDIPVDQRIRVHMEHLMGEKL